MPILQNKRTIFMAESCNRTNFTPILAKNTPGEDIIHNSWIDNIMFISIHSKHENVQTKSLSNYF